MSVINTNTKSIVAQNALTVNNRAMSKAMEQLSTGKRVNSAADDAAGLAIGQRMTAQIKGLNQAVKNANDAVSLLQTADGATIEMTNMLQRMRELAVQSATDTNTSTDRSYLNQEYQQLTKEITRIASNTQWNGMNILNNSASFGTGGTVANAETSGTEIRNVKFQVGANATQQISAVFKDFSFATGADPLPSTANVSLTTLTAASNTTIGITIGTTAFEAAAPIATTTATAAETTTIATNLQAAIRRTVGFEAVEVTGAGNQLVIKDSLGRAITAPVAKIAAGTANIAAGALTGGTASTAVAAAAPADTAVFGGTARINITDITSQANANAAINTLDNALNNVTQERAKFGSIINRLTYASDNLTNVSQNTSESRSRILDTDYAQATTELARTQIISQAATAMLAQANQAPQTVLSLLR
jgi:flagellin